MVKETMAFHILPDSLKCWDVDLTSYDAFLKAKEERKKIFLEKRKRALDFLHLSTLEWQLGPQPKVGKNLELSIGSRPTESPQTGSQASQPSVSTVDKCAQIMTTVHKPSLVPYDISADSQSSDGTVLYKVKPSPKQKIIKCRHVSLGCVLRKKLVAKSSKTLLKHKVYQAATVKLEAKQKCVAGQSVTAVVLQNEGAVPQGNTTIVLQNQGAAPQGNSTVVLQNQGAVPQGNATVDMQNRKQVAISLANCAKLACHLNTRQKHDKFHLQVSCCDYRLAMFQVF